MHDSMLRRFIRRHYIALPLCILAVGGAVSAAVLASSGSTSASEKRQIASVVIAWQRAEAALYMVPASLVGQVENIWAAKSVQRPTGGTSPGKGSNRVTLPAAQGRQILRDYAAAGARLCTAAFAQLPLTPRRRGILMRRLMESIDRRGDPPLTHVGYSVSSVTEVGHTPIGPVVRVRARVVETYATGRSSTFPSVESDHQMTRAADGRWLIAAVRSLENDGPPPPSLVPWYWERWFLWALAIELALIGLGLAVKMAAEGTLPQARSSDHDLLRSPAPMVGCSDGSMPHG